jgi:hypothetical protein
MDIEQFAESFIDSVNLSARHVITRDSRKLSGLEMAMIATAAQKSGFSRPTPELIRGIAECAHAPSRRRRRIIAREEENFFGREEVYRRLRERLTKPGILQSMIDLSKSSSSA